MERLREDCFTINDDLYCTAVHEVGHVLGTRGTVKEVSIVPEGKSLGHTTVVFYGTEEERLRDFAASLCCGFVAEEKMGIRDHSGTGYDMSVLQRLAIRASILSQWVSKESFISEAFNRARLFLSNTSLIEHHARSLRRQLVFS